MGVLSLILLVLSFVLLLIDAFYQPQPPRPRLLPLALALAVLVYILNSLPGS